MKLYTTAEAAERLEIRPVTVIKYIRQGRLKATKFGRDWAITEAALEAFEAVPRKEGWPKGRPRKERE